MHALELLLLLPVIASPKLPKRPPVALALAVERVALLILALAVAAHIRLAALTSSRPSLQIYDIRQTEKLSEPPSIWQQLPMESL